jgi:RNA polymerase sigma-70 factor, ECF subfamily
MARADDTRRTRFEQVYRDHYAGLWRYVRRRSGADLADEVVADVFAIAWAKIDVFPVSDPAPWLYRAAANVLSDRRRAAVRAAEKGARAAAGADLLARDPADAASERDLVLRAFAQLSERDREILALVAWEGLPQRDAARTLGLARPAFAMRLHRARQRLTQALVDVDEPAERAAPIDPRTLGACA